jgi:hypothetical protein
MALASGDNLFQWANMPGKLLDTLRVLDLGGNPDLFEQTHFQAAVEALHLWEL